MVGEFKKGCRVTAEQRLARQVSADGSSQPIELRSQRTFPGFPERCWFSLEQGESEPRHSSNVEVKAFFPQPQRANTCVAVYSIHLLLNRAKPDGRFILPPGSVESTGSVVARSTRLDHRAGAKRLHRRQETIDDVVGAMVIRVGCKQESAVRVGRTRASQSLRLRFEIRP